MSDAEVRRGEAMAERVARTLADARLAAREAESVVEAHRLAMRVRAGRLSDEHHPDFLHPGRVALILLLDTPLRDPVGLAAACLIDSERADLRVPAEELRAALGDPVAAFVRAVPLDDDGLTEALVVAEPEVRLVALAERLDQCRHAKFWPDAGAQRRIHAQAEAVFGPVAERTDEALARRFRHWTQAFGRTLARRG
jgi:(p)ppGpp synthase/HD superfamily hydrolase